MYSVVAAFFFVTVTIIAILMMMMLNGKAAAVRSHGDAQRISATLAREAYDSIIACNKQQILDEDKIALCAVTRAAKAVIVWQRESPGCLEKQWIPDTSLPPESDVQTIIESVTYRNKYSYWVSIKQRDNGMICLAQLIILTE